MPSYHWRETAVILIYSIGGPFSLMRMPCHGTRLQALSPGEQRAAERVLGALLVTMRSRTSPSQEPEEAC